MSVERLAAARFIGIGNRGHGPHHPDPCAGCLRDAEAILAADPHLATALSLGLRLLDEKDGLLAEGLHTKNFGCHWLRQNGREHVKACTSVTHLAEAQALRTALREATDAKD